MFIEAVNSVDIHYGWTEAHILRTIQNKLKDKAREYYGALLPRERPKNIEEMRNWMQRVFEKKLTVFAGKRELENCIQYPGEPLGEFAQRVIANKMFPAAAQTTPERFYHRNMLLVGQFIEGLEGRLANEVLRAGEFYNLDDCLAAAEECEEIVSRMVEETKYDLRMSNIRGVRTEPRRDPRTTNNQTYSRREPVYNHQQQNAQVWRIRAVSKRAFTRRK